jgi:hypothetical protein
MNDVARILTAIDHGDPQAAEQLLPLVYSSFRRWCDETTTALAERFHQRS